MKTQTCPSCGKPVPADGPEGLCPACLMSRALVSDPDAETSIGDGSEAAPSPPAPSTLGSLRYFGDYELLEEIARGGMGVVYKARQVSLNRIVAIKTILAGHLASEAQVARFRAEAEAAANLQHPNIVAIHEVGVSDGQHYFSMDYVDGRNLAEALKDGPISPGRAATYLKAIAEAVHHGHQRGTFHRDLKPQNVLIDSMDRPRVTDFGLARQEGRDDGLTRTGAVLGTPAYMPPEQAAGRTHDAGPRSDVYSLGAVLYFLLTGKAPFSGTGSIEVLRQVIEREPTAPSKLNPNVPSDLQTICLKCLEKHPERRYNSARELAEDLGRFLGNEPILARPASAFRKAWSWSARNPWMISAAATALLLGLMGLAYGLWQRNEFLNWRLTHPGESAPDPSAFLERRPVLLGNIGSYAPLIAILAWMDLAIRRQRGLSIRTQRFAAYLTLGIVEFAAGTFGALLWVKSLAWDYPFASGTPAVAFAVASFGILLVCEAVRERLVQRFTGERLGEAPTTAPTGFFSFFEDICSACGLPAVPMHVGKIRVTRSAFIFAILLGGIVFGPVLLSFRIWWILPFLMGFLLTGTSIAMTRITPRFPHTLSFLFIAGLTVASNMPSRDLAILAWSVGSIMDVLATSFIFGHVHRWRGDFHPLRLLPASVGLIGFYWLIMAVRGYDRDFSAISAALLFLGFSLWWLLASKSSPSATQVPQPIHVSEASS